MGTETELLTIKQASEWVSQYLHRNVTASNIPYLGISNVMSLCLVLED